MNELAVIDQAEIDNALVKIESLRELFDQPTDGTNAQAKKDASLELSKLSKLLDSKRADAVKPALEEQRRINGIFKPVLDRLESVSKALINQVQEYVRIEARKEQERRSEEAKRQAEALLANQPVRPEPIRPVSPHVKVSETKVWVYDVIDENEVPRAFLAVDHNKVLEAIRSGVRQVPGLRIYQETRVGRR